MRIKVEVDVFDDPEFCESDPNSNDYRKCHRLEDERSLCRLFIDDNCDEYGTYLEMNDDEIHEKCDQCKQAKNGQVNE